jgi:catecholate siderophore receptor
MSLLLFVPGMDAAQVGSDPAEAPVPAATPSEAALGAPPAARLVESVDVEGELPAVPPSNVVTLKTSADVLATPASVSIVPAALATAQDARVLGDALKNAAGVNVATGFGVFDYFVVRGLDSLSAGLVLVDGAPEPESTFYPLYNVQQVELLKGPAAFLYGGNPLAGAAHLVRKRPQFGRRRLDASLSFGNFSNLEGTLDANASARDGKLAVRLNALARGSDGYRDGRENRTFAINPALAWQPDNATRVEANVEYVRAEYQPDAGLPLVFGRSLPDVPRTRSYQSPFDDSEQDLLRLRLDATRRLSKRVTLRNKFYLTDLDWQSDGSLLLGALPGADGRFVVTRTLPLLDDRQRLLGNQLEALIEFEAGGVRHQALVGFEWSRLDDDYALDIALLPTLDLLAPVEPPGVPPFVLPGFSSAGDAAARTLAPYVLDRVQFGTRVTLSAGARLDHLDYDERLSVTARTTTRVSPLLGFSFAPNPDTSLYVSAASAFAPPSSLVVGPREPETSRQLELGAKRRFMGGRAYASAALYQLERNDLPIPDSSGVTRQLGDQRSRGAEFEFSAEALPGLVTFASYAWNDAVLTRFAESVQVGLDPRAVAVLERSGNRAAFAPRHVANAWLLKRFGNGLGVGAGLRYVSRQFIDEDNVYAIDGYALVDARVSWERGPLSLSLNFKNLTDREYETRGNGGASVLPGEPFAVSARLAVQLGRR